MSLNPRTIKHLKSTLMVLAGFIWLAAAVSGTFLLWEYLGAGAGIQNTWFLGVSSLSVLLGLAAVTGFAGLISLCLVIGVGLCVHGLVPASETIDQDIKTPEAK